MFRRCSGGRISGRIIGALVAGAAALVLAAPGLLSPGAPAAAQDLAAATWTQLAADTAGPAPRWDHTLAADETGRRLVVFGGRDGAGAPLGDTWAFDLDDQIWSQIDGPAPLPRFGQAIAVDQGAGALYLFGGEADAATFFNDTWLFDFETGAWREIDTGAGPRPAPRYGTSAVLDGGGRLIVSHGFTVEGRFDDTWSLDLATGIWTDVSPAPEARPLKRCLHEAIWDEAGGRMLLFGGCASGFGPCPLGDLWAFDPTERTWTELTPATGPAARSNPALVADQTNDRALLIAGLTAAGSVADLWSLSLGGAPIWAPQALAGEQPAPRYSHDATILGERVYVFGGNGVAGPLADLWALDLTLP